MRNLSLNLKVEEFPKFLTKTLRLYSEAVFYVVSTKLYVEILRIIFTFFGFYYIFKKK